MAGRYSTGARPSITAPAASRGSGRRSAGLQPRTFAGTPLTVQGLSRDSMAAASLMGSSIPKGILAATIGAAHGAAMFDLATSQTGAQVNIETAMANLEAISKSRSLRAVARNAEGIAPTADPTRVQSPRLLATSRGPLVSVLGMVAGDVARSVAEFDRYGYTVNRAMVPPRLDPMTKRSYWQTSETTVLGQMPQADRQAIAAAFERGVTVWTTVSEIGTHPANAARSGVTY